MRRAPIVISATVLGTAGVLLFKPMATTTFASATPADTASSSSGSGSTTGSDATTSTPSASTFTGSTSGVEDGTYTGAAETVRFGTTRVKVTISGGRITEVTVLEFNSDDPRSEQISQNAFPTLRSEVLAKQTAAVDTVSGATYTSAQYEASLQSALDKAGFTSTDGSTASTDVSTIRESGGSGH